MNFLPTHFWKKPSYFSNNFDFRSNSWFRLFFFKLVIKINLRIFTPLLPVRTIFIGITTRNKFELIQPFITQWNNLPKKVCPSTKSIFRAEHDSVFSFFLARNFDLWPVSFLQKVSTKGTDKNVKVSDLSQKVSETKVIFRVFLTLKIQYHWPFSSITSHFFIIVNLFWERSRRKNW